MDVISGRERRGADLHQRGLRLGAGERERGHGGDAGVRHRQRRHLPQPQGQVPPVSQEPARHPGQVQDQPGHGGGEVFFISKSLLNSGSDCLIFP